LPGGRIVAFLHRPIPAEHRCQRRLWRRGITIEYAASSPSISRSFDVRVRRAHRRRETTIRRRAMTDPRRQRIPRATPTLAPAHRAERRGANFLAPDSPQKQAAFSRCKRRRVPNPGLLHWMPCLSHEIAIFARETAPGTGCPPEIRSNQRESREDLSWRFVIRVFSADDSRPRSARNRPFHSSRDASYQAKQTLQHYFYTN
jgi:hypothetical protein